MRGRFALGWPLRALFGAALPLVLLLGAAPAEVGTGSCGGSLCHGRPVANGATVRQNEISTWQDPASLSGAHSRAWRALAGARGRAIAARLGLVLAERAPACLGCHVGPANGSRGPKFDPGDGVGCEACHGAAGGWLASHAAGPGHAANTAAGMRPLVRPAERAGLCLDCHFGSAAAGQWVDHKMMAAGHPRLVFELDLFTSLQRHHDEDADHARRKGAAVGGVGVWAVGQAEALGRALRLHAGPRGAAGAFPEFVFFDCRSCHRAVSDASDARPGRAAVAGRPAPSGLPVWADENLILLGAAARASDAAMAARLERDALAFHVALAADRATAVRAAGALAATADALGARFARSPPDGRAVLRDLLAGPGAARLADYQGGAQAVMAADTLVTALARTGAVSPGAARAARPSLDRAYAATRDANDWRPAELRAAFAGVARSLDL